MAPGALAVIGPSSRSGARSLSNTAVFLPLIDQLVSLLSNTLSSDGCQAPEAPTRTAARVGARTRGHASLALGCRREADRGAWLPRHDGERDRCPGQALQGHFLLVLRLQ